MTPPAVNDPASYYAQDECPSLGWEMTTCQCLSDRASPYLRTMGEPRRYGEVLGSFLGRRVPLNPDSTVVEVGGGTGSLMAALLDAVPLRDVTLVDLSPFFLEQQRAALAGHPGVAFRQAHAFDFLAGARGDIDLVVSNENLGDLPTYTDVARSEVEAALSGRPAEPIPTRVAEKIRTYGLDYARAPGTFHFNIGAVEYLELLAPRAKAVFLSEHGADTVVPSPYGAFVSSEADGFPRRIPLRGHDEYSIRFGDLEAVGKALGYRVERLHMMEFLGLRHDSGVQSMVRVLNTRSEPAEIVHEFFRHVADYQVMLLTR